MNNIDDNNEKKIRKGKPSDDGCNNKNASSIDW